MNYTKIILATLAYFISSFVVQGVLGFAMASEYFQSIPIFRNPPIITLALSQTILSGIAFSILFPLTNFEGTAVLRGLKYGLLVGLIIVPFIALDLPARFMIPFPVTWILVQGILGILHFTISGILTGLIYGRKNKEA